MTDKLAPDYRAALKKLADADRSSADPLGTTLAAARAKQQAYFDYLARDLPEVESSRDIALDGPHGPFSVRVNWPGAARGLPYTIFVRGAGWWAGNLDSHDRTARQFANLTGFPVCTVDYHCAPEARFPVQLDETVFAVTWLADHAARLGLGSEFILHGESAGASLCVLATEKLLQRGGAVPRALVLLYGNFAGPTESTRAYSRWVWAQYLGTEALPPEPAAVPLNADVRGFPVTWLAVGEEDPLVSDTLQMAAKLTAAGVPCTTRRHPGLPHAYAMLSGMSETAHAAVREAGEAAAAILRA